MATWQPAELDIVSVIDDIVSARNIDIDRVGYAASCPSFAPGAKAQAARVTDPSTNVHLANPSYAAQALANATSWVETLAQLALMRVASDRTHLCLCLSQSAQIIFSPGV